MKLITSFHVQLSELVLCGGDLVWVTVDCFKMVKHVLQVAVGAHGIIAHPGGDVLVSLAFTSTGHIGETELAHVKMIRIGSQLLGHQQQPIIKPGFLAISEHQGIRNLCGLAARRCRNS